MRSVDACPCGSKLRYSECCRPAHTGEQPSLTAERLMRSRYSAYALHFEPYLLASWHPTTRPAEIEFDDDFTWRRLQIVDVAKGGEADDEGIVEFRAAYRTSEGVGLLHERSAFLREGERWFYLDGTILAE
ncbi:SEC-C domain-containing protein [Microbacteriaceae bacterium VKM Ac-2854]|nr:SEC-C domain-containing protein [Microbacteriaceae bacterium VKM Ac-2854]